MLRQAAAPARLSRLRFASTSTSTSSSTEPELDLRSQLLRAALDHIPEHGFSLAALRAAASSSSSPALRQLAASPLALDQLFPSPPARGRARSPAAGTTSERLGPAKALFDEWAERAREKLRSEFQGATPEGGRPTLSAVEALRKRLEYNLPVLPFLPNALATLSVPESSVASLPSVRPYLAHARSVAAVIADFTRAEASLAQLSTAYALAEAYQTSSSRPSMEQVMAHAKSILGTSGRVESAVKDTWQFGSYVVDSWKNIYKSRGL